MDERASGVAGDHAEAVAVPGAGEEPVPAEDRSVDEIADLAWDDLPVALGEETEEAEETSHADGRGSDDGGEAGTRAEGDGGNELEDDGDDLGDLDDDDRIAGRRNALPRRVESWRSRSATGAIATALAMGLQQVFEPEKRRPAAVAEAPSNPYTDDDPITVDYVPDDAESTTVHVKPWLLEKGDPS